MNVRTTIEDLDPSICDDISSLKCRFAEEVYHRYIRDAYGIKDCCKEYDPSEIDDLKMQIGLLSSGHNCKNLLKLVDEQTKGPNFIKPEEVHVHRTFVTNIITKSKYREFYQNIPTAIWLIDHELGFNPNVTAVDGSNSAIDGIVTYLIDGKTLQIEFNIPIKGKAYLS